MKHNILWGIILLVASLSFTAKAQKAVQGQFSVKGVLLDSLSNEGGTVFYNPYFIEEQSCKAGETGCDRSGRQV